MKKRNIYVIFFIVHAILTIVLNLMSMGWQMAILDTGGTTAPVSLKILDLVALVFTLPFLLPAALVFPSMGYSDPINNPIYLVALIVNSALVAWFVTRFIIWRKKND